MTVGAALARGRAARTRLMRDTVTVTRVTGRTFNSGTGQHVPTTAQVYQGVADVKPLQAGDQDVQAGEGETVLRRYDVALPYSTVAVARADDTVTVTASDDARLVGRALTVMSVEYGPRSTAHHYVAEDRA